MAYTGDKPNQWCSRCRKRVRLVRCKRCGGKGGGLTTQCRACNNSGYVCENSGGDPHHRWW